MCVSMTQFRIMHMFMPQEWNLEDSSFFYNIYMLPCVKSSFIYRIYGEFFASGNFGENAACKVC